jgi:hypothetical protein
MAFNPFASFRKYQKYWMAAAVLVCMLTFVLCSGGMKGTGLDDLILVFTRRRGDEYARVNNRRYTYEDLQELKNQRNLANDFMRELTKIGYDQMVVRMKNVKSQEKPGDASDREYQQTMAIFGACMQDLADKYREPRYFQGGTKLDDLVDFILWRDLADKYGVNLTDEAVKDLVYRAVHAVHTGSKIALWVFDADTSRDLQYKLRATHSNATDSGIFKAVREEFRVQILRLAYLGKWSPGHGVPIGMGQFQSERDILGENWKIYLNTPMQVRAVPTPEQISANYRKVRTELTIDLLPVSLEELAKKETLPEDRAQRMELLKNFYLKYAKQPYNPTSDKPGFVFPERAEVQYMVAEPTMEYYKGAAETVTTLEKVPPVAFNPLNPLVGQVGWLATQPAWLAKLQADITQARTAHAAEVQRRYDTLKILSAEINKAIPENLPTKDRTDASMRKLEAETRQKILLDQPTVSYKYGLSPLTTAYFWNPEKYSEAQAKPSATAVAAMLGAVAGADGPLTAVAANDANAYANQLKLLEPMLTLEKNKRIKVGLDVVLAQAPDLIGGGAFTQAAMIYHADQQAQYMPIAGFLETELTKNIEKKMAQNSMNAVMLDCKAKLEAVKGRDAAFTDQLAKLQRNYTRQVVDKDGQTRTLSAFELHQTAKPRNAYDIDLDPALFPLQSSFNKNRFFVNSIEGRAGKPEMLREGDFAKLFFGSEPLGVGNQDIYVPKVWPPYVSVPKQQLEGNPFLAEKSREQRLFDKDEKPFVFWKTIKLPQAAQPWDPNNLRLVDFTETQYRMFQARTKLLEEVKQIAEQVREVQRAEDKNVEAKMKELAQKHGTEVIVLQDVAQLVENKNRGPLDDVAYVEYTLPAGKVPFAREDMVKDLLKLNGLTTALKFDDMKELTDLNEKLFSKNLKPGSTPGQLQVLTNKPRTVYYLAMVSAVRPAQMFHYFENVLPQAIATGRAQNLFVDQVQTEYGKELLKLTLDRLRMEAKVEISDLARKQFAEAEQAQQ